jgi:hypothetical protein
MYYILYFLDNLVLLVSGAICTRNKYSNVVKKIKNIVQLVGLE